MAGSGLEVLTALLPWARRRPHIFISYRRRGDSAGFAARLADRMVAHFGDEQCFRDIEDIETGADFVQAIEEAVSSSRVMVVVIGSDWATVQDGQGRRRLDNPEDFVRLEVATALRRGIRVIPVLVAGASMPSQAGLPDDLQGLWRRQAIELSDTRWDYDVGQLTSAVEGMGIRSREKRAATKLARRLRLGGIGVVGVALVGLGLALAKLPVATGAEGRDPAVDAATAPGPSGGGQPAGSTSGPISGSSGDPSASPNMGSATMEVTDAAPPTAERPVERSTPPATQRRQPAEAERASEPPPSAVDRYRAALVAAIDLGNEEQNHAQSTLDVTRLATAFTGQAYQLHLVAVSQLFQLGLISVNTLLSQRYGEFWIDPTETVARVDVVERWTSEFRNAITGGCISRVPAWDVPQTVQLRRSGGGWIIDNIDIGSDMPGAVPC